MDTKHCEYEDETIKYFTCQLSAGDLVKAEAHIAICPECCQTIADLTKSMLSKESEEEKAFLDKHAKESVQEVRSLVEKSLNSTSKNDHVSNIVLLPITASTFRKSFPSLKMSQLALAASLFLVLSIGAVVLWMFSKGNTIDKNSQIAENLAVLNEVNKIGRPTELRLADFDYSSSITSRGEYTTEIQAKVKSLEDKIKILAIDNPSAEVSNIYAQQLILLGQNAEAIKEISKAIERNPKDVKLLTTLTVAYGASKDFQSALEVVNKVLAINENYLPGVFNRAVIYQELHQNDKALLELEKYLSLDSDSLWAKEARERLNTIKRIKLSTGINVQ